MPASFQSCFALAIVTLGGLACSASRARETALDAPPRPPHVFAPATPGVAAQAPIDEAPGRDAGIASDAGATGPAAGATGADAGAAEAAVSPAAGWRTTLLGIRWVVLGERCEALRVTAGPTCSPAAQPRFVREMPDRVYLGGSRTLLASSAGPVQADWGPAATEAALPLCFEGPKLPSGAFQLNEGDGSDVTLTDLEHMGIVAMLMKEHEVCLGDAKMMREGREEAERRPSRAGKKPRK